MTIRADTADLRETPLQPLPATGERLPAMRRLVPRSALFGVLSDAGPGQVVLLCAPAGSGKTVLLRSWVESEAAPDRVAWVSVERGEEDAQHFWLSVVDAVAGAVGERAARRARRRHAGVPRRRAWSSRCCRDLARSTSRCVLVVDDLHELRSPDALRLLEHVLSARAAAGAGRAGDA